MTERPKFVVTFTAAPGIDNAGAVRALKWLLKRARRQYGPDDAGPREKLSTSVALWHGIDRLHDAYLTGAGANPDKLPLVILADTREMRSQDNVNYEPVLIINWVLRPADLPATGIAVATPAKPQKRSNARTDLDDTIPF